MNEPSHHNKIYAQRPVRSDFARRSAQPAIRVNMRKAVMSFIVAVIVICVVYGLSQFLGKRDRAGQETPTVMAQDNVKEHPADEGGIDIPHQDVDVFQRLDDSPPQDGAPAVDQLLPEPESPNADSAATQDPSFLDSSGTAVEEATPPPEPQVEEPAAVAEEPPAPVVAPEAKKEEPKKEAPVKKEKAEVKKEATDARLPASLFTEPDTAAASKATSARMVQVQLGSYQDGAVASKEVLRLEKSLAGSLNGGSLRVVQADLGAKGIYYRVMSSSMPESDAKTLCEKVKAQKGNCLVVR